MEKSVKEVRDALSGTDASKIKSTFEQLQKDIYDVSAEIYKDKGPGNGGAEGKAEGGPEDKKDEKTMDAEYKEKK